VLQGIDIVVVMEEALMGGQYKLAKLMKKGQHCEVYHCVSIKDGKAFAAKLQPGSSSGLLREATVLSSLQEQQQMLVDYGLPVCHFASQQK
jgi:hypothetical protein